MIRINAYSDGFRKEYLAAVKKNVSIMDRKAVVASSKKFLPLDFSLQRMQRAGLRN